MGRMRRGGRNRRKTEGETTQDGNDERPREVHLMEYRSKETTELVGRAADEAERRPRQARDTAYIAQNETHLRCNHRHLIKPENQAAPTSYSRHAVFSPSYSNAPLMMISGRA